MSDKIRPALTPDEWVRVQRDSIDEPRSHVWTGLTISYTDGDFLTGSLCNPYTPEQMLALVVYNLPDGHPLKITRADVSELESAAACIEGEGWDAYDVRDIAAKLAALLPPEGT